MHLHYLFSCLSVFALVIQFSFLYLPLLFRLAFLGNRQFILHYATPSRDFRELACLSMISSRKDVFENKPRMEIKRSIVNMLQDSGIFSLSLSLQAIQFEALEGELDLNNC